MLEPKEKAEELYFKYSMKGLEEIKSILNRVVRKNIAKQCALIAVNEILKQCFDYRDIDLQASYDYWQEVKTEIKKL
jgi:hypothetical protein